MYEIGSLGDAGMAPRQQIERAGFTPAADPTETAIEGFGYLVGHIEESGGILHVGCADCRRWMAVRTILLSIFEEPERPPVGHFANRD